MLLVGVPYMLSPREEGISKNVDGHCCPYEECCLLEYYAVWSGKITDVSKEHTASTFMV